MGKPKYYISKDNEFVIENYNQAPTFASFFPGIAGVFGCPMWVFYANRGQCITSAGVQDKNGAMLEFQPANKAFRAASLQQFRTFLKVDGKFYEPFAETSPHPNQMLITADSLKLVEENKKLKLRIEVLYFTLPNTSFPGLGRIVRLVNLGAKKRRIEIVDGLPILIPFGFDDSLLKRMSTTTEAWCTVENLEEKAPFFKLKVLPADISETKYLEKGNFFLSYDGNGSPAGIVVEPAVIFGPNSSFEVPVNFLSKTFRFPTRQVTEGFTPSAFAYKKFELKGRGEFELNSLFGQMDRLELLNGLADKLRRPGYLKAKYYENKYLIDSIYSPISAESASGRFDLYSRYTFLDNVMRGGLPVTFGGKTTYLYYRKHGDMERDYNDFKLMPTYFSQGNGNYRDINQNRRSDLFFYPDIGEDNIRRFYNLIQLDGFNPLVVLGSQYYIKTARQAEALLSRHFTDPGPGLVEAIVRPFLLGELLKEIETQGIEYRTSREEFAADLLSSCETEEAAQHGEGFWTDHFSYNTDLLESFESIYPDRIKDLLFEQNGFTFFDNDHIIYPRSIKYRIVNGQVRQYESVHLDLEKSRLINGRESLRNAVRAHGGRGNVYYTTLAAKILCVIVNKAASFDAEGIGIEMEADKPDWYDALNGLPGLFGSSLSETLELKRLCQYLRGHFTLGQSLSLPVELKDFLFLVGRSLAGAASDFEYWDQSYQAKEEFRLKTRFGVSGEESRLKGKEIGEFLLGVIGKCDQAVKKALGRYKTYRTYFINEAVEFEQIDGDKARVLKFKQTPLPLFLEGFVHALKVEKDRNVYGMVKNSPLYDRKLKMYKVNAPLKDTPVEIGRARIFTPGWLENESVWLHMEYKYLLELLKAGMHQEFFADLKNALVPFMNPGRYKRSILENSSFIVSSANPNKGNHGRGFVARLSGCAAEFIEMWILMMAGRNIFSLDEKGRLTFKLSPVLPGWLFKNGRISFRLLGSIEVTYMNPKRKDTFGGGVKPVSYRLIVDDKAVDINAASLKEDHARLVRERKIKKIVVQLR